MNYQRLFTGLLLLLFASCQNQHENDANRIIDECIAVHGGDHFQNVKLEFDFRAYHVKLRQQQGQFLYQRSFNDSTGRLIEDELTNQSFVRRVNHQPLKLSKAEQNRFGNAVNSIAYFVLLPFKLNDPAAQKTYVGQITINGQPYDKIRVTFKAEGGGNDFHDVFYYWIHQKQHTMDYMAYSEGGPRFRKAVNPQEVGGMRFQNYVNYTSRPGDTTSVSQFDQLYQQGKLTILSHIEQKNIRVTH